jgi:hypothetical protein
LGLTQNDTTEIKALVLKLFDGMRAADSTVVKDCFHESASMFTAAKRNDQTRLFVSPVKGFVQSVGLPHEELYDERLGEYTIDIDDILASMEVEYYFFLDDNFSHCGTNFFTFFKSNDGWKIISIADTRRKGEQCEIPDETW